MNKEKLISIDLVAIPPKNIRQKIIDLNQSLKNPKIILGESKNIPHISFRMTTIKSSDLKNLAGDFQEISEDLETIKFFGSLKFDGKISSIKLENTEESKQIFQKFDDLVKKYNWYKSSKDSIYLGDDGKCDELTFEWIDNNFKNKTTDNFYPHITIGFGKVQNLEKLKFETETFAIYQLGNLCTCAQKAS